MAKSEVSLRLTVERLVTMFQFKVVTVTVVIERPLTGWVCHLSGMSVLVTERIYNCTY
jgi:hypothetical protein